MAKANTVYTIEDRVSDAFKFFGLNASTMNTDPVGKPNDPNAFRNALNAAYKMKSGDAAASVHYALFNDKATRSAAENAARLLIHREGFKRRISNMPKDFVDGVNQTVNAYSGADKAEQNADAIAVHTVYLGYRHGCLSFDVAMYHTGSPKEKGMAMSALLQEAFGIFDLDQEQYSVWSQRMRRAVYAGAYLNKRELDLIKEKKFPKGWNIADKVKSRKDGSTILKVHPVAFNDAFIELDNFIPVDGKKFTVAGTTVTASVTFLNTAGEKVFGKSEAREAEKAKKEEEKKKATADAVAKAAKGETLSPAETKLVEAAKAEENKNNGTNGGTNDADKGPERDTANASQINKDGYYQTLINAEVVLHRLAARAAEHNPDAYTAKTVSKVQDVLGACNAYLEEVAKEKERSDKGAKIGTAHTVTKKTATAGNKPTRKTA